MYDNEMKRHCVQACPPYGLILAYIETDRFVLAYHAYGTYTCIV